MPTNPTVAPYGSWRSPITAELVAGKSTRLSEPWIDGDDTYWIEGRPLEGGRNVVVRRERSGALADITPPGYNVRTLVHEYGGGAYLVDRGVLFFSNYTDQRLYRQQPGGQPAPITPPGGMRYADGVFDRQRDRIICVAENHAEGLAEAENSLVAIPAQGGDPIMLTGGRSFYAAPRLSPDGGTLAWMAWDHPNMPWDAAELWLAPVMTDGSLGTPARVAGGEGDSVFQPAWSPEGTLYFVAERTGWWNLYRLAGADRAVEAVHPAEAEFGQPHWVFRVATYGFADAERLVAAYSERGVWSLAQIDMRDGTFRPIATPYDAIGSVRAGGGRVVFAAGSPTTPGALVELDLASGAITVLRQSFDLSIDPGYLSIPQVIEFPTTDGRSAYGFFYPPRNTDYAAPEGARPPLIVSSHGGPTGATDATLSLRDQYWTSRGFALLDVNYGGSTGYGREYRQRLDGAWGIVDVDDCANGARYLAERGLVDGSRMAITGGSAGGYTTLCALAFRDTFQSGASHFGVADPEMLARDTHKFESRYLDRLIGPYPERLDLYHERSPIHHVSGLECPVIFFQGLEDKVVPPNQAEAMVDALRAKGIPVAYVPFEGEQHGFRKAENIIRAMEGELLFYQKYLLGLQGELPGWIQDYSTG
jgi:dipeptidyl aminopeptidase/acylaminoacyl peptidase